MSTYEYIVSLYSIFVGVVGAGIIMNWARLLKEYPNQNASWTQIVISINFFLLLIWEWSMAPRDGNFVDISPISLFGLLINPILLYSISYLTLPQTGNESLQDFQKQKMKIAILSVLFFITKLYRYEVDPFEISGTRIQIALIIICYIILAIDRRKMVWDISSIALLIFMLVIFTNVFAIGKTISIAWAVIILTAYAVYFVINHLKSNSRNMSQ